MSAEQQSGGTSYEILVEGILSADWSDWLAGMSITALGEDQTLIAGTVPDQSALYAILMQLHSLNVTLIAVRRVRSP